MTSVTFNTVAILAAASSIGVHGEHDLHTLTGVDLTAPLCMGSVALLVAALPISASDVCEIAFDPDGIKT